MAPSTTADVLTPRIVIPDKILKRLNDHAKSTFDGRLGFLYGCREVESLGIVGCALSKSLTEKNFVEKFLKNRCYFPVGIDPVGVFVIGRDVDKLKSIIPCNGGGAPKLPSRLVIWFFPEVGDSKTYWYDVASRSLDAADFSVTSGDAGLANLMTFRVRGNVRVNIEHEPGVSVAAAVASALAEVKRSVLLPLTCYLVLGTDGMLLPSPAVKAERLASPDGDGGGVGSLACSDILLLLAPTNSQGEKTQKKRRDISSESPVINVNLLFQLSTEAAMKATHDCAPVLFCDQKQSSLTALCLPLDVLVLAPRTELLSHLPSLFGRGLLRQLDCMQKTLSLHQMSDLSNPVPYHFKPAESLHYITVVYCDNETDANLEPYRKFMHQKVLLPVDRPLFRRANRHTFDDDVPCDETVGSGEGKQTSPSSPVRCLRNTHVGLPTSGVKDGRMSCVRGLYAYHHYSQDGVDDVGWGCAYRSLQTLVSWFRLQGYSDVAVPKHRQIQEALVAMGDKAPSFIGSKQWIGSTEVSYCLDKLLGVTSKILFVNSGSELASKGRELLQHFDVQGTPIMIGGGVLAHTILGVDYSDLSGDIRFLILDPHYTGGEDLKVIQEKGWCGWKGPAFWDQNAHYNLCLPQRPITV